MKTVAIVFSALYVGVFVAFLFITHAYDGHHFGPPALDFVAMVMTWGLVAAIAVTMDWGIKQIAKEPIPEPKEMVRETRLAA